MTVWKNRFIIAFIVLFLTIIYSFFVDAETTILAITNTTFIVGLFLLMLSSIIYISLKWAFPVFKYGFGERKRADRNFNTSTKANIDAKVDLSTSQTYEPNHHLHHLKYDVDYEVDPEVLRERKEYEEKKKSREKQIYAIPFTTSAVLILASILFNVLYYLLD